MPTATPSILALDTATDVCSVALAHDGNIVEAAEQVGNAHSQRVLPMIEALLRAQAVQLAALDAIAFGAGPGSFTGLRIACGVAQGLAYGADKPVIAIGNLRALAAAAHAQRPAARRMLCAIDARMHEAYWATYTIDDGLPVERAAPALATAAELARLIARERFDLIAGDALAAIADELPRVAALPQARASARWIAALALDEFAHGRTVAPAQAAPLYVRDRVALTLDERRARAAQTTEGT
jgi:tRNA threonylcarbamoyladenosine biosynthesis protein TsaB